MTRWLFVHSSDELYGADRVLLEVLSAMTSDERRWVTVWLPTDTGHGSFPLCDRLASLGVRVEHVPLPIIRREYLTVSGLSMLMRRAAAFRQAVAAIEPDVVYGTTSATLLALTTVTGWNGSCRLPRRPRVILHNQEIWQGSQRRILGALAKDVDRIIAVSAAAARSLAPGLADKATVVPNSTPDPATQARSVPLRDPTTPLRFLAAGRWTPLKALDVVVEAWAQDAPGELTLVGGPPPSGTSIDVAAIAARSPNAERVHVVGEVHSLAGFLEAADVIVMASRRPESFGLVALEAMAAGRPVVVSDVGALPELVDQDCGWIVPVDDPTTLAEVLNSITAADARRRRIAGS